MTVGVSSASDHLGASMESFSAKAQHLSNITAFLQADPSLSSFKSCRQFLVTHLKNPKDNHTHSPVPASWNSIAQGLQRAVKLTREYQQTLLASANDSNGTYDTLWECFRQQEKESVISALEQRNATLEWQMWIDHCNCAVPENCMNRTDVLPFNLKIPHIPTINSDVVQSQTTVCFKLAIQIAQQLMNVSRSLTSFCRDSWCDPLDADLNSICDSANETMALIDDVLDTINSCKQLMSSTAMLQDVLLMVKGFADKLHTALHQPQLNFGNFQLQAANVLCYAARRQSINASNDLSFPAAKQLRLCPEHCNDLSQILGAIDKISVSSHMPGSLTFLRHTANTHCARYSKSATQCAVIDNGEVYVQNRTNNSTNLTGKFCANFVCHHPLRSTSHPDRVWQAFAEVVSRLESTLSDAIGDNSSTRQSHFLSCGMKCLLVGYAEEDLYPGQIVVAIFGYLAFTTSVFALITFALNWQRITALARRVMVFVNFAFFLLSLDCIALPSKTWSQGWSSPCFPDDTLQTSSPAGFDTCFLNATRNVFTLYLFPFTLIAGFHSWTRLVRFLSGVNRKPNPKLDKRLERIYLSTAVSGACVLTAVSMLNTTVAGDPLTGRCFPTKAEWFYFFPTFFIISLLIASSVSVYNFSAVWSLLKKSRKSVLRDDSSKSLQQRREVTRSQSLDLEGQQETRTALMRLFRLFSLYLFVCLLDAIFFTSYKFYLFLSKAFVHTETAILDYITCQMVRCDPSECQSPDRTIWLAVSYEIYPLAIGASVTLWAFRQDYWQRYLPACFFKRSTRRRTSRSDSGPLEIALKSSKSTDTPSEPSSNRDGLNTTDTSWSPIQLLATARERTLCPLTSGR